jgi:hypothetical protein
MSFLRSVIADARPSRAQSKSFHDISALSLSSYNAFETRQDNGDKPVNASAESSLSVPDSGKISQAPERSTLSQRSQVSSQLISTGLSRLNEDAKSSVINTSRKAHFEPASSSEKTLPETPAIEVSIEPVEAGITPDISIPVTEFSSDNVVASEADIKIEAKTQPFETQPVDTPLNVELLENNSPAVEEDFRDRVISPAKASNEVPQETIIHSEGVEIVTQQADIELPRVENRSEIKEIIGQVRQAPAAIKQQRLVVGEPATQAVPVSSKPALSTSNSQVPENDAESRSVNSIKSPDLAVAPQSQRINSNRQNTPPEALLQAKIQSNQAFPGDAEGFSTSLNRTALDRTALDRTALNRTALNRTALSTPKPASVKIGQVDVFIESPSRSKLSSTPKSRPSSSFSSRHYLRRL